MNIPTFSLCGILILTGCVSYVPDPLDSVEISKKILKELNPPEIKDSAFQFKDAVTGDTRTHWHAVSIDGAMGWALSLPSHTPRVWSPINATHCLEFVIWWSIEIICLCVVVFDVQTRCVGLEQALVDRNRAGRWVGVPVTWKSRLWDRSVA